jgi:hypothetical protein
MSTVRVNTIQNTSGVEVYTTKAWVNFNGTGTIAILASGNVASLTDNGTGDYTVNITSAITDANYGCFSMTNNTNATNPLGITALYANASGVLTKTTTAVRTTTGQSNTAGYLDRVNVSFAIIR